MQKPASATETEKTLETWGNRLLRPGVRRHGRPGSDPHFRGGPGLRGAELRAGIRAVVRRAPEVMVKVTGGGRGMRAIRAHLGYISRHGELALENDRGEQVSGKDALLDLAAEWQYGGALIPLVSHRREAFHVMLSMPPETDAGAVLGAAREFAREAFAEHKYAFVLHDPELDPDSYRPHVHLIVRAQGRNGERLNPRKADLARWREAFAERLMERGVPASATRRQSRGVLQPAKNLLDHPLGGVERKAWPVGQGVKERTTENEVLWGWKKVVEALAHSPDLEDRRLALEVARFVTGMPAVRRRLARQTQRDLFEERTVRSTEHERERGRGLSR